MTKRSLSIVSLLIQTVSIILIFSLDSFYNGWGSGFKYFEYFSDLDDDLIPIGVCFVFLVFLNIVFSIVGIFKQNAALDSKKFLILPVLEIAIYVISYICAYNVSCRPYYNVLVNNRAGFSYIFYVEIIIMLFNLLVEALKRFTNIPYCKFSEHKKTASSADELKKFKELFDSGAITQEEFDAKKKQLLGL